MRKVFDMGLGNKIILFKSRVVDLFRPVDVYRNINGGDEKKFSIRQNGLVVGHTNQLQLKDCKFIVNKKAQQRVRREKRKNVHAFIRGTITLQGGFGTIASDREQMPVKVSYNPYTDDKFMGEVVGCKPFPLSEAWGLKINKFGVSACYTN